MRSYEEILENNRKWVNEKISEDPYYFERLSKGQSPGYLFIGCSDSRIPLSTFTKTEPGEIFVHRNIANLVKINDTNFLAVLEYSLDVLKVNHIIVCGHYDCGGVKAVFYNRARGYVRRWLRPLYRVYRKYLPVISNLPTEREQYDRLAELSVIESVNLLSRYPMVKKAIQDGKIKIHGWVIDIYSGYIKDLKVFD
ncbi:MAG: carbonic anhydrase [Brevinematia bacterium]